MDATDLFILILMGLALAVVFYYRKTIGNVWSIVGIAVAGVGAASTIIIRKRKDDPSVVLKEAMLKQNEKRVGKAVKELKKFTTEKEAIDAKHEAAKADSDPDKPDPNVVDFLKHR